MAFCGLRPFVLTTNRATKTVASDQKQLKQLHDCAALGYQFRDSSNVSRGTFAARVSVN